MNHFNNRQVVPFCSLVAGLFAIATCSALTAADNWSSFQRGGDVAPIALKKPLDLKAAPARTWEQSLIGYGQSSPVLWQDQLYVTTVVGPNKEQCRLSAYDVATGKELWFIESSNPSPQESTVYVSRAAPTPVADSNGVIAMFEGGILVAADHAGKIRWQRNLVEEHGAIASRHGLAASLE